MFLIHKVYFIKKIVIQMKNKGRKEWHFVFNETLNTFYLRLLVYGVNHMVKYH